MENKNLEEIVTENGTNRAEIIRNRICIDESKVEGIIFKVAETKEELEGAYRILHDAYVKEGYIDPHPSGMKITPYNFVPGATTFVGKKNDEVIFTVSLYPDSKLGLPLDVAYKEEVDQLRAQGLYLAEVGSLAVKNDYNNKNQNLLMHGNKIMLHYAINYLKFDELVISIKEKQKWFYENIYLFHLMGGIKYHPDVRYNSAIAMKRDLRNITDDYRRVYNKKPISKNLYSFFFEKKSDCIILPSKKVPINVWSSELLFDFFKVEK